MASSAVTEKTKSQNPVKSDVSSTPGVKLSAASELGSIFLPVFILLSIFVILSFTSYFMYSLIKQTEILKKDFIERGNELVYAYTSDAERAFSKKSYKNLIGLFQKMENRQNSEESFQTINEVFLLHKDGQVLAHSDLSKLTKDSKTPLNKASGIYNNELFHMSIMKKEGTVYHQEYPYDTFNIKSRYLLLIEDFFPKGFFAPIDFSTVVSYKKQKATFHVVMSIRNLDTMIKSMMKIFSVSLGIGLFIVLIIAVSIKYFIQNKVSRVDDLLNVVSLIPANSKLEEEISKIDSKLKQLELEPMGGYHSFNKEVKDAIVLKEH